MTKRPKKTIGGPGGRRNRTGRRAATKDTSKTVKKKIVTVKKTEKILPKETETKTVIKNPTIVGKGKLSRDTAKLDKVSDGKKLDGKTTITPGISGVVNGGKLTGGKVVGGKADIATSGTITGIKPGELAKLRAAFDNAQKVAYKPKFTVPKVKFNVPDGIFVARPELIPSSLSSAKEEFEKLRSDIPVLLMPVRLETRFTANRSQLKIRIFPDQASIDTLDSRLTQEELDAGTTFLDEHDKVENRDTKLTLWHAFATAYAPRRAAKIVRAIRAGGGAKNLREPGESSAATAPLLPNRWFVTGYAGGKVAFDKMSASIAPNIAFAPDLNAEVTASNDLAIDPEVKWMTDYPEAVRKGMGVTVSLPSFARDHIDEIYVIGIKTTDGTTRGNKLTPAAAAGRLSNLLESHLLDWGAGFTAPATATNNTSDVEAGWTDAVDDLDEMYARLIEETAKKSAAADASLSASPDETMSAVGVLDASNLPEETNFSRLERVLGLPDNSTLKSLKNRTGREDAPQAAMNALLWPVTLGELFGPLLDEREDSFFTSGTKDWLRNWFITSVRGGAPLPTLQLGRTPYGVLPMQKTHLMREPKLSDAEARRRQMVATRLRSLLPYWEDAAHNVLRMGDSLGGVADQFPAPGDRFLQILRQQPNPAQFSMSKAVSERSLFDLRYEIRNLGVHPDHNLQLLQDIFRDVDVSASQYGISVRGTLDAPGKDIYNDWPRKFTSGTHQIEVLSEKRQVLIDLQSGSSRVYTPVFLTAQGIPINVTNAVKLAMLSRSEDMARAAEWLQDMIDICVDHKEANAGLEASLDLSSSVMSGIVGYSSEDPHLTYLSFDNGLKEWNSAQHVTVQQGNAPVRFDRQVDYLLGFADSFISSSDAPAEPTFPGGKKPLLFRLLKEAIYRTGVDEETMTSPLFEMTEMTASGNVTRTTRQTEIGGIVGTMAPADISGLTKSLKSISTIRGGARVKFADERVARTLRGTSSKQLSEIATSIDVQVASQKSDKTSANKELSALSSEIKAIARKGDTALKGLTFSRAPNPRRAKINEMKAALTLLRELNEEQIELLLTQTLGLASWRLDAWLTSLPMKRIEDLRDGKQRTGIQVGAFGWVQNLKPNNRDAGDGNRVRSQGYIHTPSLNHAKTAAVLRAGWTNYGTDAATSPMAVDLTSERMRDAEWIFSAARRGQDLGDVLGYRFERFLKDKVNAAHWIFPIRQAVLHLIGQPLDPEQPGVDGLELNRLKTIGKTQKLKERATIELRGLGGEDKANTWNKAELALEYLTAQIDGLADAAISDSVHALVQGNLLRAGSSLSAISDGEVPPPELEILKTATSVRTQTHRVAFLTAPQDASGPNLWTSPKGPYPAALADPDADDIVAELMGPPSQLVFEVAYIDTSGAEIDRATISWADMIAKDSAFAAPALQTLMLLPSDGFSQSSDLAERVLAHAITFPPKDAKTGCTVQMAMPPRKLVVLNEVLDRWLAWRAVVADARPLAARDISMSEVGDDVVIALADLEARAKTAIRTFEKAASTVLSVLPEPTEGNEHPRGKLSPQKLLGRLDTLARLGLTQAAFRGITGTIDEDAIWAHAWSMVPRLRKRLKEVRAVKFSKTDATEVRVKTARTALRAVFGERFPATTRLSAPTMPALGANLAKSPQRLAATSGGTPAQWIEKMGYVRPAMRALNDAMLVQDCQLDALGGVSLSVAQWPEDAVQPWIAVDGGKAEVQPKTSLVAVTVSDRPIGTPSEIAGLVIDEVVDRVPSSTVNTGVALHFDAPNTEAPQTMLLALPPVGDNWSYAAMVDTVRDAFHLARIRSVDGHLLPDMNQVLPAIYANKATIAGAN